ncbi:MAG: RDD family protein [Vicingaceae bacterium]|nr:RDD family protein [Vicingaceae bacterium]
MNEEITNAEANQGAASDNNSDRVGFGPRLGAYLIDMVFNGIVGSIIGGALGATLTGIFFGSQAATGTAEGDAMVGGIGAMLGGMIGTIAGIYLMSLILFIMEGITGQTPGKMLLKLKNKNEDGAAAGASALWTRALLKYIGAIMALLAGVTGVAIIGTIGSLAGFIIFIGCFFVLGQKRQAIHDLIAKTAVFKK